MSDDQTQLGNLIVDYTRGRVDRRQFIRRATGIGLSLPAATALLAACGGSSSTATTTHAASPAPVSKNLRVRMESDMDNLDPAIVPTLVDFNVAEPIMEGLITYKPGTWDVVNCLAESFEPSSDHLHFHFKLKQGIPFHKGYGEVTAEDVKYSYERIAGLTKPNLHSPYQGDWMSLKEVKVESKYAGTIIMKQPFAPLLRSTLPVMSGKVLSKKAIIQLGKKFATQPIGSGPYEFGSWVPGQHVILNKFAQYGGANSAYAKPAQWDTITGIPIVNDSAAETALLAGDIDFGAIGTGTVDKFSKGPLAVHTRTTLNYQWMSLNVQDPMLSNINLRKAVRSSIDVPAIIQAAYNGKWSRAYAILPPGMAIGYWSAAPHYPQNIPQAKQFLKASGLSNVHLKLNCVNAEADKTASEVIQANIQQSGINCTLTPVDPATFNAIPGGGGGGSHRQLVYAMYVTEPDPSWSIVWFTCAQLGLWNWTGWCNKEWNNLYNQGVATFDDARRNQIYIQMQQQWDQQANIVWIAFPTDFYAGKTTLTPSLRPDGNQLWWNYRSV
jgi:peptide/nickel transport system substrate-binding protein